MDQHYCTNVRLADRVSNDRAAIDAAVPYGADRLIVAFAFAFVADDFAADDFAFAFAADDLLLIVPP